MGAFFFLVSLFSCCMAGQPPAELHIRLIRSNQSCCLLGVLLNGACACVYLSRVYSRHLGKPLVSTRTIINWRNWWLTGNEWMGLMQGGKSLKMSSKNDLICDISGFKTCYLVVIPSHGAWFNLFHLC